MGTDQTHELKHTPVVAVRMAVIYQEGFRSSKQNLCCLTSHHSKLGNIKKERLTIVRSVYEASA